jgi:multiple sugar transport system permease protein
MTRRGRRTMRIVKRVALYAAALGFTAFAVFPFYWMFLTAFKQNRDLYVGGTVLTHIPWIFNAPPTMEHVNLLFQQTLYLTWVKNTVSIGAAVVVITLLLLCPPATPWPD